MTVPSQTSARRPSALLLLALLTALGGQALAPAPARAQGTEELRRRAEQRLGQDLTDQEIIRRLRQSGLSPQQIRDRLRQRGYDPSAAEPWLRALGGEASQVPQGARRLPIVSVLGGAETGAERLGRVPSDRRRFGRAPPDTLPPVFGRSLFRNATSQFQPSLTGPVPEDYRIGPGDRLQLVLTGAVQQAYELTASPDGWIVIPEVGRVPVAGKTLSGLRETLYNRLSQVYSGITREPGGKTQFEVSVSQIRTIQVYVVGEVTRPAAYRVSGMATALTALYRAGGPTRNGSFRNVVVNRGGEAVAEIDLYDYLLRGRAEQDVRLRSGDIVFVPVAGEQVRVSGPVSRPAIYELRGEGSLRDLFRFAGGVQPTAELRRVQIERILPPGQRAPGRDRAILDVPVGDLQRPDGAADPISLKDGDRVTVFAVLEDTRNQVRVSGGVWRPGTYGTTDSTRLWDVIQKAGGLQPDVYQGRAQIQRLQEDYTRRMIPVSLARDEDGEPVANPKIEGMDQIYIYAKRNLREDRAVSIGGWVREPGTYPYVEGMTVEDLILKAGGLRTGAFIERAEVSRVRITQARTDTLTRHYQVPLDSSYIFTGAGPESARGAAPKDDDGSADDDASGRPDASEFRLENLDAVYVRKAPGFEPQQTVRVTGEVRFPGPYSIRTREDRLTDIVRRAGGLTSQAYPEGFQLWRREEAPETGRDTLTAAQIAGRAAGFADTAGAAADTAEERQVRGQRGRRQLGPDTTGFGARGQLRAPTGPEERRRTRVGIDFETARENPGSSQNVRVEPGDSVYVPEYTPTVAVRGAVGVETKVLYRKGAELGYYIRQAGGYAQDAAQGRTRVRYANGEIDTKGGGFLFFGGGVRAPDAGSTVFVPEKPRREGGLSPGELIGMFSTLSSALATVVIAIER